MEERNENLSFNDDFRFKNKPDETTPLSAENLNVSLINTCWLKQYINDLIAGKISMGKIMVEDVVSKNLIRNQYKKTVISNGITFTYNSDGTYTISGKNNGSGNSICMIFDSEDYKLKLDGTYYSIPISNTEIGYIFQRNNRYLNHNTATKIVFENETLNALYFQIPTNTATTFNNVKVYPMLSLDETAITPDKYVKHKDF